MAAPEGPADTETGESLEELYHDAPCGYVSCRADGTIVSVNRTFVAWTGYPEDSLIERRRLQDLLTPGGQIYYETHYRPMLDMQGTVREVALDIRCADGRVLPVLLYSAVRERQRGAVVRTLIFDATERREYERELLRARRAAEAAEERARALARTLQESLIPPALPAIPGFEIGGAYRPEGDGSIVGGDFYDVFGLDDGAWGIVIGDVEGKGPEAATVTALARYSVRAAAVRDQAPRAVLATVDQALLMDAHDRYCTLAFALLELDGEGRSARIRLGSAGHPLPMLVPASGPPVRVGASGTLAGALTVGFDIPETIVDLASGDLLVFFTDGLIEGRSGDRFFGEDRVVDMLHQHRSAPPGELVQILTDEVVRFQHGSPSDDIAVVALRRS